MPVLALLFYEERIIGRGYNEVMAHNNAGGYAEIKAITDAMQKIGAPAFQALDISKVTLISAYEPCHKTILMVLKTL